MMRKGTIILLISGIWVLGLLLILPSKSTPEVKGTISYNIIILLDLSDRIDPQKTPGQVDKDKKIIQHLISIFEEEVRKKLYLLSKDRLCFAIAPQPTNYAPKIPEIANHLRIDMQEVFLGGKPRFDREKENLLANVNQLYEMATANPDFIGADIWTFFRDNLEDYVVKASVNDPVRNVLIILTDGYIDFEASVQSIRPKQGNRTSYMEVEKFRNNPGWEKKFDLKDCGLMSIGKNFSDLEVLFLEINLRKTIDKAIVEKYWFKWFDEMNIGKRKLKTTEDSSIQVEKIIREFLKGS